MRAWPIISARTRYNPSWETLRPLQVVSNGDMVVITNDDADPFARSDASPSRAYVQSFQEHSFLVTKYEMTYIRRRTSITDNTLIIRVRLLFIRLLP